MAPTILERLHAYVLPGLLMIKGAVQYLHVAITSPTLPISNFSAYRDLSFAKFWIGVGPVFADIVPPVLGEILATSHGVILDIGPGSGDQLFRFSGRDNITMIYGVEPGVDMHHALRENAEKAGLGEKYKILSCGAEPDSLIPTLKTEGLLGKDRKTGGGIFDEIVCIRVLCGVPQPNETIEVLYGCLKPGGRLVVCEHVMNENNKEGKKAGRFFHKGGSRVGHLLQSIYTAFGWEFLVGCQLRRDTTAALMNAAKPDHGWAEVNLKLFDEWTVLPHVVGYCVKKP